MAFGVVGPLPFDREVGHSYAGVLARAERADLVRRLAGHRFSGWVGPQERGWVTAVAEAAGGAVAAQNMDVDQLAGRLAATLATATVAVTVRRDRLLMITGWQGDAGVGRYLSDPSVLAGPGEDVLSDVLGAEHTYALAGACAREEVGDELHQLLSQSLAGSSVFESERLGAALALLDLPRWLVSSASLPRDVPAGPPRRDFVRLRAGRTGPAGVIVGPALALVRRRRRPPAIPLPAAPRVPPELW